MKVFGDLDYFILYANCIPTKGTSRSLICDYQRHRYFYIPNDLFEILELSKTKKLHEIYQLYTSENKNVLDEYFDFMLKNDLGFVDDERDVFPDMSLDWDFPAEVSNAILDVSESHISQVDYVRIFSDLSYLNCSCVQLRSFDSISSGTLQTLCNLTLNTRIKEVRLVLKFTADLNDFIRNVLLENQKRISQVIFFGSPSDESESVLGTQFIYTNMPVLSEKDCGQICSSLFSFDISHHTESLKYNSCLNRKISVDANGFIKNCPSQQMSYGHVNETSLKDVIIDSNFQKLWHIKKDDIKICQSCEHRYICTDCRIFVQDKDDLYSKPAKCSYDPATASWN